MKASTSLSRSGSSALELIFFLIMLGLGMYWVTLSLMPENDKPGEKPFIERSSMMRAAEMNAKALSEKRREEDAAIRQITGKTEDEPK